MKTALILGLLSAPISASALAAPAICTLQPIGALSLPDDGSRFEVADGGRVIFRGNTMARVKTIEEGIGLVDQFREAGACEIDPHPPTCHISYDDFSRLVPFYSVEFGGNRVFKGALLIEFKQSELNEALEIVKKLKSDQLCR